MLLGRTFFFHFAIDHPAKNYMTRCMYNWTKKWQGCLVGFPWPANATNKDKHRQTYDPQTGMDYNCYVNEKLETLWIPKLKQALRERHEAFPQLTTQVRQVGRGQ